MDECSPFDDNLFSILKECKTLPKFLDAVFGFLKRRTDFYCIAAEPKSPVGLPEGWAEHFVKEAFFKWKPPDLSNDKPEDVLVPEVENEVEIQSQNVEDMSKMTIEGRETGAESIEPAVPQEFTASQSYNGAVYDNYAWSQNITDIDIFVKVPEKITSKDLFVSIQPQKILIKVKATDEVLLEGDLCHKVKHHDAVWSLDKKELEIHLDKAAEMWWDCLVRNEPKIDVAKIDCSRPFEELPEEAQAKIEELTWNQERKRLGLPTSNQLVMQEKLKKAWNAEGSPFKGPFDPSTVIIDP